MDGVFGTQPHSHLSGCGAESGLLSSDSLVSLVGSSGEPLSPEEPNVEALSGNGSESGFVSLDSVSFCAGSVGVALSRSP